MQQDYILRMIEQFSPVLADIIRNRESGNEEQALDLMEEASVQFLEMDLMSLLHLTPESLDREKCLICADLLFETAMLCESQNEHETAKQVKEKALGFYQNGVETPLSIKRMKACTV